MYFGSAKASMRNNRNDGKSNVTESINLDSVASVVKDSIKSDRISRCVINLGVRELDRDSINVVKDTHLEES
jgi:hypothetical protein